MNSNNLDMLVKLVNDKEVNINDKLSSEEPLLVRGDIENHFFRKIKVI